MSAAKFLNDYKAYFVDHELRECDERRLVEIFDRYKLEKEYVKTQPKVIIKERIVYRDRVINNSPQVLVVDEAYLYANKDIILKDIAEYWNMSCDDLKTKSRTKERVWARFHSYLIFRSIGCTMLQIANIFNRDHTTVIHGLREAKNMLETKAEPFYTMYANWVKNHDENMQSLRGEEAQEGILSHEKANERPDCVDSSLQVY